MLQFQAHFRRISGLLVAIFRLFGRRHIVMAVNRMAGLEFSFPRRLVPSWFASVVAGPAGRIITTRF